MILLFCCIGLIFIPVGIWIIAISDTVVEVESTDYSASCCIANCDNTSSFLRIDRNPCEVNISVKAAMEQPIYLYYKLTNYFQNHRRYVKSRDDIQVCPTILAGASIPCPPTPAPQPSSSTHPHRPSPAIARACAVKPDVSTPRASCKPDLKSIPTFTSSEALIPPPRWSCKPRAATTTTCLRETRGSPPPSSHRVVWYTVSAWHAPARMSCPACSLSYQPLSNMVAYALLTSFRHGAESSPPK